MNVSFIDLKAQYQTIKSEIDEAINRVLLNTSFILGPEVENFEKQFAEYCGAKFCVGVNSGTAALHLALLAAGIKEGDEVITVPNTFFATCEAISVVGAKPVFVDADSQTYLMDISKIEAVISPKTRAIIPVHLFGQTVDMDPLLALAKKHNFFVLEDACQSHGAKYRGKKAGSLGNAAAFSFYPGKNLGAYGEAGAVVTNDEDIAKKIKMLRDHGSPQKYIHDLIGFNMRMEGIQGAVLSVKLKYLDQWLEKRRRIASRYNELLKDLPIKLPKIDDGNEHVFHLYVIATPKRNELSQFLKDNGVSCGIHYPIPIHLQKAYADFGWKKGDFPVCEKAADEILSLPMFAEMTDGQIAYVAGKIKEFYAK